MKFLLTTGVLWVGVQSLAMATATPVVVSGKKLLVNSHAFTIQGVNYSPTPVGQTVGAPSTNCQGPYQWWTDRPTYVADFPLIQKLGANTIRVYGILNAGVSSAQVLQALDEAHANNLYVVMGYFVQTFYNLNDPAVQSQIQTEVLNAVGAYKNHPAVLMWAIGNEVNLNIGNQNPNWYSFLNTLAGNMKAADPNHPVTTVQGECPQCLPAIDYQIGSAPLNSNDAAMTNLDLWSVTAYRGPGFNGLFTTLASATAKPVFVAEFGKDAYRDATAAEDQAMQASHLSSQWSEIASSLSVNLVGGSVFEWTDEWWKDATANACNTHGTLVAFTRAADVADPAYNEEWFGLSSVDPIDAVSNVGGTKRNLRQSYFTMQGFWNTAAANVRANGGQPLLLDTVRNYPNPFRLGSSGTKFVAFTSQAATIDIAIYDAGNQLVTTLKSSGTTPGRLEINWDGRNHSGEQVSSGLYIAKIEAKGGGQTVEQFRKVVAVR